LREIDNIHKQAREATANWFVNNQKAKVNTGPTEGPRKVSSNDRSRSPGPKPDEYSRR
jgi:hypothetical protein